MEIAVNTPAKERFLAYARAAADPALRARLVVLAQQLGWLSEDQQRDEWVQLLADRLQRGARASDVDLACRLGRDGTLAQGVATLREAGCVIEEMEMAHTDLEDVFVNVMRG